MIKRLLMEVALVAAVPSALRAPLAFETPRLLGPESPRGLGVHFVRAGTLPGDHNAILVTWSPPGLPESVSLRGGSGTGAAEVTSAFGGIDVRAPIVRRAPGQPVEIAWTVGLGAGVGEYTLLTLPLGLSVGRSWSWRALWGAPYVAAGAAVDYRVGNRAPEEGFEVSPSVDLGIDLSFDSSRRLILRAATSLGDRQAVAVGVLVRAGR